MTFASAVAIVLAIVAMAIGIQVLIWAINRSERARGMKTDPEGPPPPLPDESQRDSASEGGQDYATLKEALVAEFGDLLAAGPTTTTAPDTEAFLIGTDPAVGQLLVILRHGEIMVSAGFTHEHFDPEIEGKIWTAADPNRLAARNAARFCRDILAGKIEFTVARRRGQVTFARWSRPGEAGSGSGAVVPVTSRGCLGILFRAPTNSERLVWGRAAERDPGQQIKDSSSR